MILIVNEQEVELREGTIDDVPLLMTLIRSMAAFEKLTVTATEESLRTTLFGETPAARVLLAFVKSEPVAYATYFFTFSTMVGKRGLWLDDLYVVPEFRGQGLGTAIMGHLADIAIRHQCGRMEWMVLDWNEAAIGFYDRLGASILGDWRICRLEEEKFPGVAGKLGKTENDKPA